MRAKRWRSPCPGSGKTGRGVEEAQASPDRILKDNGRLDTFLPAHSVWIFCENTDAFLRKEGFMSINPSEESKPIHTSEGESRTLQGEHAGETQQG